MRDHDERNQQSRERMTALTERMDAETLRRPLGEHWTIAASLVHMSYWDGFVAQRWTHANANGLHTPASFESLLEDLVNDTLTPLLLRVPAGETIAPALEAALAVNEIIAALSDERVAAVQREGRVRVLDRSIHRTEHLDEIEAALG